MAVSEQARRNHDELFGEHVSTLAYPFIGYPRTLNALRVLDEVVPADEG
jgi:hypothetical protein